MPQNHPPTPPLFRFLLTFRILFLAPRPRVAPQHPCGYTCRLLRAANIHRFLLPLAAAALALVSPPARAANCAALAGLHLPHTTITTAEPVTTGTFTPPEGKPLTGLPPFCRVAATLRPSADSEIRIELWMPADHWNQRFEGTGNGGFAGKISYGALAEGLRRGYAVANTDMGMATPPGETAAIFIGRPERWIDWGSRATHEMTVAGKQIARAYYDHDARHAYFTGCSTGGEQALMEAQRFPDDYDGIVGGAPAHNRTGVHVSILWNFAVNEKSPAAYLPAETRALLTHAVVNACDALDSVADGVLNDPTQCHFNPASLACAPGQAADCLTPAQIATVTALYAGPVDPRTGQSLYPGLPRGSEFAWQGLDPHPVTTPPYFPIFQWVFGKDYDWRQFDFDHADQRFTQTLAPMLNATNPDLDTFRRHGHKLLLYHGWADWLVAPGETIRYYDTVMERGNPTGAPMPALADSLRLFMVPGMSHCAGGPGATHFDALSAMVDWVEKGKAPERIVASTLPLDEPPTRQRPLCPWPRTARYQGAGNPDVAASFICTDATH